MAGRLFRSPFLIRAVTALVATAGLLSLRFGYEAVKPAEASQPVAAVDLSIIALADGSTMVAERGTFDREMVDWLNHRQLGDAKFPLAGDPFEPGSTAPTREFQARISGFAAMMKGSRGVKARVALFSDETAGGSQLAAARAERLRADLVSHGISARRVTVEVEPVPAVSAPARPGASVRSGQLMFVLQRRS